jgi:excisionase family DNA binding protein
MQNAQKTRRRSAEIRMPAVTHEFGGSSFTADRPPAGNFERLLDAIETAQLIHCHVKTLERYARQGSIPGYKIHGRWYFRASDLDSWLQTHIESVRHPCRMNQEEQ